MLGVWCVAFASVALLMGCGSSAMAVDLSSVTIENLFQPGEVSAVPQPPLVVIEQGSCASLFTATQADGGSSSCPAGSWPGPRVDESSPGWSPVLQVAGGDTVRLTFSTPVQDVMVAAASQMQVGLQSPAGPVHNIDEIPPTHLQPTADPKVWLLALSRPLSDLPAWSLAIVATDGSGAHDFAAALSGPRWDDYRDAASDCGTAWFGVSTFVDGYTCPGKAIPPGEPHGGAPSPQVRAAGPPPRTVRAKVSLRSRPRVVAGRLLVRVYAAGAGTLRATVRASGARIGRLVRRLHRASTLTLRIPLDRVARRASVRGRTFVRVRLDISFVSPTGTSRASRTVDIGARALH